MTEADIIKILSDCTDDRRFPWQLANSFVYKWESDFWTMTSGGTTREFEIKISRSDYFADARKDKHRYMKPDDGANFFYFVCPKDLIKPYEVDKRYGLIYAESMIIVKKPQRLHDKKFDRWEILANKMYWKFRTLWREKYIGKEITLNEYREGFAIKLEEHELSNSDTNVQESDTTEAK